MTIRTRLAATLPAVALVAVGIASAAQPIALQQDPERSIARRLFFSPQLGSGNAVSPRSDRERREIADRAIAEQGQLLFGGEEIVLEHLRTRNSLSGTQVFYRQLHGGIPVEGSELVVTMDRDSHATLIWNDVFPGLHLRQLSPSLDASAAIAAVDASQSINHRHQALATLVILPRDGGRLVYRVEMWLWSPHVDWLAYVDARSGELIEKRDRMVREKPYVEGYSLQPVEIVEAPAPSSLAAAKVSGTGLVLPANPLNDQPSRWIFEDGDDVDPYRESVTIERLDGSGYLRGPYADVNNVQAGTRVLKQDFVYEFSAMVEDSPFEEVNTYWHVDVFQNYIKTVLGIDGANDEQQRLLVHYNEVDNSQYTTKPADTISFGDGGVDDSEDGEIVLHEYGHAIHDAISGLNTFESENAALSEGFGDYCAATFGGNPYVGEWDATSYSTSNNPPYLRRTDLALRYPSDWIAGRPHDNGRIISSAWWDLRAALGAELADRLVIESFFYLPYAGRFKDFADGTIQADLALYGGAHLVDIFYAYDGHGIPMTSLLAGRHVVPADSEIASGSFPVTLTVVSTRPLAASNAVRMYFRYAGDPNWNGPITMGQALGDDWTANIPGPNVRTRVEYYFEFENDLGTGKILPEDAPDVFYSFAVGTSLAASGIEHTAQRDLPLEEWPPRLEATLVNATPDQKLYLRYQIGDGHGGDLEMSDDGSGVFSVTLPPLALESGVTVRYALVAPTESGELIDGPYAFKILAPSRLLLRQNAPNPFNPSTEISFLLPWAGRARLVIYDVAGRRVRELLDEELAAGSHARNWDGRDDSGRRVASGVYLYRLETPAGVRAKRMTLAQ